MVVGQFFSAQIAQGFGHCTHGAHILFAVSHHLIQQRGVFAEGAVSLRDRQQPNQLRATVVLLHVGTGEPAHVLQRPWRAVGAGLRGGAVELLDTGLCDTPGRAQDVPEDQPLKRSVVGTYLAPATDVVINSRWDWLSRLPCDNLIVAEGVAHAQDFCGRILRIVVCALGHQIAAAASLKVKPEDHEPLTFSKFIGPMF